MTNKRFATAVCVTFIVGMAARASAQPPSAWLFDEFKGLAGVRVVVAPVDEDAERDGLTRAVIQADVETKLGLAGIRVLTEEEYAKTLGRPVLMVSVDTVPSSGIYVYSIRVELTQTVQSLVRPGVAFDATTWSTDKFGIVDATNVRELRDAVGAFVDDFASDWNKANPKQP